MIKQILFLMLVIPSIAMAGRLHPERWYQQRWCDAQGGQMEVVLPDRTRCDCLTASHAVEFDFSEKWSEGVGQALYYALQAGCRAGVVLIVERPEHRKHWVRLNTIIKHYDLPIDTWMIEP